MPFTLRPLETWDTMLEIGMVASEAQSVIAMRVLGMFGLWPVSATENSDMITEKVNAMTQGMTDANTTFFQGGSSNAVAAAAIAPVRRATQSNAHRLSRRNPGAL